MKCFNCQKRLTKLTVEYCPCGTEFCKNCLPDDCNDDQDETENTYTPDYDQQVKAIADAWEQVREWSKTK